MLFCETWLLLALSRSLIFFWPFRRLRLFLGNPVSHAEAEQVASELTTSEDLLKLIQLSIIRAGHRSPWRTKCFEQALAARMMLFRRRIQSVIFFGVHMNPEEPGKKMSAHAWLICSNYTVTGGKDNTHFNIVGCFVK